MPGGKENKENTMETFTQHLMNQKKKRKESQTCI